VLGSQISHYRILSRIGQGGMGEVYLAEDLQLDRKVALKLLPEGQAPDETARRRLLREANAAARLDHPFITKVYEVGLGEAAPEAPGIPGIPFIAMELVEGETLKARLARGWIPLADALRIASEIAEALEFARQRGIVHRDLKPANVMLTGDGHAKVMDFGIAKQVSIPSGERGRVDDPSMTSTGEIAGTPAYMAPEQLKCLPIDSRADIFALGVCLYEMVTGTHPFMKDSAFAMADAIVNQPAPPLDRYLKDAPEGLEHVFRRALAKEADQRYQSFKDLRIDLGAVELPQTRTAIAPPVRVRGRPRWLIAALVALVAAGGALAWWLWPVQLSVSQRALAFNERDWILVTDFKNLTGDPVFDRSLRVALDVAIAQSQYVNVFPASRVQETLRLMKKAPTDTLDESLAAEIALREHIKAVLACSITGVGESYTLTAQVIDPQSRVAVQTESTQARGKDEVLPALDKLATRVRRNLGESLNSVSAQKVALPRATTASLEALRLYAESLRPAQEDVHLDMLRQAIALDPDFAMAHASLGHAYYLSQSRQRRQEGEAHFVKALSVLDRLSHRERLWISALAEDSRGNRDAAVSAYRTYLAEYPDDQAAWFRVGWTYLAGVHQPELAVEAFKQSIALNPSSSSSYINLATAYAGLDKYKEAVEQYQRAFDLSPSSRTDSIVNHEYGFVLVRLGDLDGASANFARMLTEKSTSNQARGQRSMALLEMYRGRYGAAIDHLRQAVVINKTNNARVSEYRDRLYLARAYQGKGMAQPFAIELDAVHRLALDSTLAPEWLRRLGKIEARSGRVGQARTILALMSKTAGDATAAASMNRNAAAERAHFDVVRGEIELSEGRVPKAVEFLQSAYVIDPQTNTLDSLATALLGAGQLDEAAKRYEEVLARNDVGNESQEETLNAEVRLAEIYTRLGRRDRTRELCDAVLTQWKTADDDLVLLKDARKACAGVK
jgi:serine/threonine protein kinase/tetratricopeptide (TPR) repeat protein